jgi:hypothetical protein
MAASEERVNFHYELHGLCLDVEAGAPALASVVDNILHDCAVAGGHPEGHCLRLDYADSLPPLREAASAASWSGYLPGEVPITIRSDSSWRQIEMPGLSWANMDLAAGRAEILVRPGKEWCLVEGCLVPALCEWFGQVGQYVVHAASLFVTAGSARRAVIVAGASGAGKTSTALHLAHEGLSLLSDDASFVGHGPNGSPMLVWGLPVQCKVLPGTVRLLPWLADVPRLPGRVAGESVVYPKHLPFQRHPCAAEPAAIVFLGPRNPHRHELSPLNKIDALERLTRENVRAYDGKGDGRGGRAFGAMAELVRSCRTYALSACPRLEGLGELLRSVAIA